MKEIWKDIKGYEGLYQVSNLGRVKNLERKVRCKNAERTIKEKILILSKSTDYIQVSLSKRGKSKTHLVHRLVAQTFIPNKNNYKEINHKDCNKHNNCVENLEWCSRKQNMLHAKNNGLIKSNKGEKCYWFNKHGKDHGSSKKIIQFDKNGKLIKKWDSLTDVTRELRIWKSNICKCCEGKRKTAGGYVWKYNI